jgi:hypothetical protein
MEALCVGGSFLEFGNVKCLGRGAALRPLDLTPGSYSADPKRSSNILDRRNPFVSQSCDR